QLIRCPLSMKLSAPVAELSRVRSPSSQLPQPQTILANTQVSAKTGFFRGSWETVLLKNS
ncbi:hypothetical protein ACRWC7_25650, partial [Escherichia coli]